MLASNHSYCKLECTCAKNCYLYTNIYMQLRAVNIEKGSKVDLQFRQLSTQQMPTSLSALSASCRQYCTYRGTAILSVFGKKKIPTFEHS